MRLTFIAQACNHKQATSFMLLYIYTGVVHHKLTGFEFKLHLIVIVLHDLFISPQSVFIRKESMLFTKTVNIMRTDVLLKIFM